MKYSNTIALLKIFANALFDPTSITNNLRKNSTLEYQRGLESDNNINNSINNNIYAEPENSNIEYNKSVPMEDSKSYNSTNNESNNYYNNQQNASSNPQGLIDSITQEITPVRLQQAIILSEIVGKPRSKTRKKRRY